MKNLSARVRILLLVVLASLPLLGVAVYNSLAQRDEAEAVEKQQLQLIAGLTSRRPQQIIEGASQLLFAVTADIEDLMRDRASCTVQFRKVMTQVRGLYRTMGLILPNGDIYCNATTPPNELKVNVSDRDYFRMAMSSGKFSVGSFLIGRAHGLPALNLAYPVLAADGRAIAVAYASLSLDTLEEQELQRYSVANKRMQRVVTIIDYSGVVLAQFPQIRAKIGEKVPNPRVLEQVLGRKSGLFTETDPDGVERIYAFDSAGVNPDGKAALQVVVSTPSSVIYAEAARTLRQTVIGIGLVTLLLFVLAWFGAEVFVTRRFHILLGMTERVRAGDFSARTGFSAGREELNRLGLAFDEMARELQRRDALLQDALERLRSQAVTDELTGLFNRRYLWSALEAELVRARRKRMPMAVMLFDIDHFKILNDRWGHEAGDLVLQGIAQVARRVVRGTDIVARHGGEEFVVVMPEAGEEVAMLRARELRVRIAELSISYQGQSLGKITVSIGVAVSADASHSGDTLVREADTAMYEAKTRGRDQVVVRRVTGAAT